MEASDEFGREATTEGLSASGKASVAVATGSRSSDEYYRTHGSETSSDSLDRSGLSDFGQHLYMAIAVAIIAVHFSSVHAFSQGS